MKLLKPTWVTHDDLPIFSIDIHPDGSRFATGGQGEDSGRIVIWNMAPVVSVKVELDENVPKMLCQMDNHLACVNCVRWSFSGKFLASGGDDKLVMIWKICKYTTGGAVFGSGGKVNVETWRCASTLRGHGGDVLDIAWSPHDAWLATCSVDNSVIVWNALKLPEMVAILKGHTGLVKGVTWDPVGKFLASQSDDKTLRVWRTADWKEDQLISEPFEGCGGTTHVLRLSWSPDGLYLVSAHAMNGGGPTAQIIERDTWKKDTDFVGHRKAVTCVRFNSNILQKSYRSSSKPQQYCCLAIGSRDRSLSVWITALKRPLVVINDLFENSVLDLTWSRSGLQLMACCWDGSVAYIEFTEEELGRALSKEEKTSLHERMYGKCLPMAAVVETPEFLAVQTEEKTAKPEVNEVKAVPTTPIKGPINKQIETRTSDGKRRITPMYVPPAPDAGDVPAPFTASAQQPTFSSSSETKSRIVVEKRDDIVVPNVSNTSSSLPEVPVQNSTATTNGALVVTKIERASSSLKRSEKDAQMPARLIPSKVPRTSSLAPIKTHTSTAHQPSSSIEQPSPLQLPMLTLGTGTVVAIPGRRKLCVENDPHGQITKVKLSGTESDGFSTNWKAVLGSPACAVAANVRVVAIACENSNLHLFDTSTGIRPLPPIVLPSPASKLCVANPAIVMAVSSSGYVSVWDIARARVLVKGESMLPLLQQQAGSVSIAGCSVTDAGCPTVSLSTGKCHMFSIDLGCWILLGDSSDPVLRSSNHATYLPSAPAGSALPLANLQGRQRPRRSAITPGSALGSLCTLSTFEHQLTACKQLQSPAEYKHHLLGLAHFLVDQVMETRLRVLCDDLLGPTHGKKSVKNVWESTVMGFSKHSLLIEILTLVKSNLNLQRLYTEYNDQLNSFMNGDVK